MNPKVDSYLENVKNWKEELQELRKIILDCGLTEEFKWRNPCYQYKGKNILLISGFKEHCRVSFFKGVLLKDTDKLLKLAGPNSRSVKIATFHNTKDILELEPVLKRYIFEAIELEKAGIKVAIDKNQKLEYPEELNAIFDSNTAFKEAFENLTKGRQRGYVLHFNGAKQSKTKSSRIEKCKTRILEGYGLNDCTCGYTKRKPNCDGSHNRIGK